MIRNSSLGPKCRRKSRRRELGSFTRGENEARAKGGSILAGRQTHGGKQPFGLVTHCAEACRPEGPFASSIGTNDIY